MTYKIAVLPGDGIGPEVTAEALKVLEHVGEVFGHTFTFNKGLIGYEAIKQTGKPLPEETLKVCNSADAILLGAVGAPEFDNKPNGRVRPEQGLLQLRKELNLHVNVRPVKYYEKLEKYSPLKPEIIVNTDMVFIRELTGGIYFGDKVKSADGSYAIDTCKYTKSEIERALTFAFVLATKRKNKITLVDKANVLETSRLWREVFLEMAVKYPKVKTECMYVDSAAMKIIQNPNSFDVIVTENMFGDILTDEASVIGGSIGLLPSASIGDKVNLYEPIHGSYPLAAGLNIANPIGAILSAAMMLDYSFNLKEEANYIYSSVEKAIENGIVSEELSGGEFFSTSEIGNFVSGLELDFSGVKK